MAEAMVQKEHDINPFDNIIGEFEEINRKNDKIIEQQQLIELRDKRKELTSLVNTLLTRKQELIREKTEIEKQLYIPPTPQSDTEAEETEAEETEAEETEAEETEAEEAESDVEEAEEEKKLLSVNQELSTAEEKLSDVEKKLLSVNQELSTAEEKLSDVEKKLKTIIKTEIRVKDEEIQEKLDKIEPVDLEQVESELKQKKELVYAAVCDKLQACSNIFGMSMNDNLGVFENTTYSVEETTTEGEEADFEIVPEHNTDVLSGTIEGILEAVVCEEVGEGGEGEEAERHVQKYILKKAEEATAKAEAEAAAAEEEARRAAAAEAARQAEAEARRQAEAEARAKRAAEAAKRAAAAEAARQAEAEARAKRAAEAARQAEEEEAAKRAAAEPPAKAAKPAPAAPPVAGPAGEDAAAAEAAEDAAAAAKAVKRKPEAPPDLAAAAAAKRAAAARQAAAEPPAKAVKRKPEAPPDLAAAAAAKRAAVAQNGGLHIGGADYPVYSDKGEVLNAYTYGDNPSLKALFDKIKNSSFNYAKKRIKKMNEADGERQRDTTTILQNLLEIYSYKRLREEAEAEPEAAGAAAGAAMVTRGGQKGGADFDLGIPENLFNLLCSAIPYDSFHDFGSLFKGGIENCFKENSNCKFMIQLMCLIDARNKFYKLGIKGTENTYKPKIQNFLFSILSPGQTDYSYETIVKKRRKAYYDEIKLKNIPLVAERETDDISSMDPYGKHFTSYDQGGYWGSYALFEHHNNANAFVTLSKLWDPSSSKDELSSFSLLTQQVEKERPDDKSPYTKKDGKLTDQDIIIHNKISISAMFLYYAFLYRFGVFTKMITLEKLPFLYVVDTAGDNKGKNKIFYVEKEILNVLFEQFKKLDTNDLKVQSKIIKLLDDVYSFIYKLLHPLKGDSKELHIFKKGVSVNTVTFLLNKVTIRGEGTKDDNIEFAKKMLTQCFPDLNDPVAGKLTPEQGQFLFMCKNSGDVCQGLSVYAFNLYQEEFNKLEDITIPPKMKMTLYTEDLMAFYISMILRMILGQNLISTSISGKKQPPPNELYTIYRPPLEKESKEDKIARLIKNMKENFRLTIEHYEDGKSKYSEISAKEKGRLKKLFDKFKGKFNPEKLKKYREHCESFLIHPLIEDVENFNNYNKEILDKIFKKMNDEINIIIDGADDNLKDELNQVIQVVRGLEGFDTGPFKKKINRLLEGISKLIDEFKKQNNPNITIGILKVIKVIYGELENVFKMYSLLLENANSYFSFIDNYIVFRKKWGVIDETKAPFEMTITDDGSLDFQVTDIYKALAVPPEKKEEIEQLIGLQGNTTLQKDIKKSKGKSLSGKLKAVTKKLTKLGKILRKTNKISPSSEPAEQINIPHVEISKDQLKVLFGNKENVEIDGSKITANELQSFYNCLEYSYDFITEIQGKNGVFEDFIDELTLIDDVIPEEEGEGGEGAQAAAAAAPQVISLKEAIKGVIQKIVNRLKTMTSFLNEFHVNATLTILDRANVINTETKLNLNNFVVLIITDNVRDSQGDQKRKPIEKTQAFFEKLNTKIDEIRKALKQQAEGAEEMNLKEDAPPPPQQALPTGGKKQKRTRKVSKKKKHKHSTKNKKHKQNKKTNKRLSKKNKKQSRRKSKQSKKQKKSKKRN